MKILGVLALVLALAGSAAEGVPGPSPGGLPGGGELSAGGASPEERELRLEEFRRRIMALVYEGRWHDAEEELPAFRLLPSATGRYCPNPVAAMRSGGKPRSFCI